MIHFLFFSGWPIFGRGNLLLVSARFASWLLRPSEQVLWEVEALTRHQYLRPPILQHRPCLMGETEQVLLKMLASGIPLSF